MGTGENNTASMILWVDNVEYERGTPSPFTNYFKDTPRGSIFIEGPSGDSLLCDPKLTIHNLTRNELGLFIPIGTAPDDRLLDFNITYTGVLWNATLVLHYSDGNVNIIDLALNNKNTSSSVCEDQQNSETYYYGPYYSAYLEYRAGFKKMPLSLSYSPTTTTSLPTSRPSGKPTSRVPTRRPVVG